jgi:hypothetical protein
MMAAVAYEGICERAVKMVDEALPGLGTRERVYMEAGIAAGVTAAIQVFKESGLLK